MRRFLALSILAASAITCALSTGNPDDPLTILVSDNLGIVVMKPFLAAAIVWAALRMRAGSLATRWTLGLVGSGLFALGTTVFISTPLLSQLYEYIRVTDVLLLMLAGTVLNITALEMKPRPSTMPARLKVLQPKWIVARGENPRRLSPA